MHIFAGIRRGDRFSPNHIGNDSAIFNLTAQHLKDKGYLINDYAENELSESTQERFIFSMARDVETVKMLQKLEDNGAIAINSGYGVENCYRSNMTTLLDNAGILIPKSKIVDITTADTTVFEELGGQNIWVKRGDFHAIHKEDVTFVRNAKEGVEILREYALRGIATAVICSHIVGDLVKFYGVLDTDFFYWFYPTNIQHSKFGHEEINGKPKNLPFSIATLRQEAERSARILKIAIYGGDAIITSEGSIYLIDVNDWPSFAPCREEAAVAIANHIHNQITKTDRKVG
ncbi:MAG: hypothetical protein LBG19_13130 [Prevotellaceae bacterium]|jgi:hypothetical protein|nr:hypothetical protein [Prevotellaceae bacterium]